MDNLIAQRFALSVGPAIPILVARGRHGAPALPSIVGEFSSGRPIIAGQRAEQPGFAFAWQLPDKSQHLVVVDCQNGPLFTRAPTGRCPILGFSHWLFLPVPIAVAAGVGHAQRGHRLTFHLLGAPVVAGRRRRVGVAHELLRRRQVSARVE